MVPFGLAQAPAYFQLLMNKVLHGLDFAKMYPEALGTLGTPGNCFQSPEGSQTEDETI